MKRITILGTGLLTLLALTACGGGESNVVTDADRDGYADGAGDCDDYNNTVHAGAPEIAGDGVDQDCDGEDTPAEPAPPPDDRDADGYTLTAGDCDDFNDTIHPGARERSGDGLDSNCDGDERPKLGPDRFKEVLGLIDTDKDGAISLEEFEAACAEAAMVVGQAEPGILQTHAACSGTNACRGMMLHPWGEFFEHDCAGINHCTGWSCTEALPDAGRAPEKLYVEVGCNHCHGGEDGAFKVYAHPGESLTMLVEGFLARPDSRLRGAIAYGIGGTSPGGIAYENMPAHYRKLSRAEIDAMIAWIRKGKLQASSFEWGDDLPPAKPE